MTASPVIGNARAFAAVQRALASASPPHAWLFVGPEGVGKAGLARWLAQAVNCERNLHAGGGVGARHQNDRSQTSGLSEDGASSGTEDRPDASPLHPDVERAAAIAPCGECGQCDRIARGIHADVVTLTIPPAEEGPQHKEISVDQIREVQRAVSLAPFEGRTRVVIIDPADKLSEEAQNAFLKTLEEPPPNAVFVLIATQVDALLPTVRSRCTRIEFGLVPTGEIEQALRERGVAEERAQLLARLATGRPEKALALADDPSRLEKRSEALAQARALAATPMADLMDLAERLAQQFRRDRETVLERLDAWLSWWRDLLLVSASGESEDGVANVDMLDALREDAGRYEWEGLIAFVQALRECRRRLEGNVQARIALDACLVRVPRAAAEMRNEK
jgi:DNA polymerase III subunit delta'